MILIASKKDGFHRGGIRHPLGVTKYPDGTFTDEQMEKFKREPMLFIEIVPDSKAEGSEEIKPLSGEIKPPDPKAEASEGTKTPDSKKTPEKGENASNAKKKST